MGDQSRFSCQACGQEVTGSKCTRCGAWHCWRCHRLVRRDKEFVCGKPECASKGRPVCKGCTRCHSVGPLMPEELWKRGWAWGWSEQWVRSRIKDHETNLVMRKKHPEAGWARDDHYMVDGIYRAAPCPGCDGYHWEAAPKHVQFILPLEEGDAAVTNSPEIAGPPEGDDDGGSFRKHLLMLARECREAPGSVLVIGPEDEDEIALHAADFGSELCSTIVVEGPRGAFKKKLFGVPIEWGDRTYVRRAGVPGSTKSSGGAISRPRSR
jgi:hypothetical protein